VKFIDVDGGQKKQGTQVTRGPGGTRDVGDALTMRFALIP